MSKNEKKGNDISIFQKYLTVWVLTEVPVMLFLVKITNQTRNWFSDKKSSEVL